MGTRNLTVVISGGQHRVAQYGQWDGYPGGQGCTVLDFCRERLLTAEGLQTFKEQLGRVRFVDGAEVERMWKSVQDSWEDFCKNWPYMTRELAAGILEKVFVSDGEVVTRDHLAFASDSLFCEWAYVVDLDAGALEVYTGFNTTPVPAGERFSSFPQEKEGGEYFPIRLARKFLLSDLPSNEAFLRCFEEAEDGGA